jgi:phospho-N-acetylmuramoyl-pentapeptide-transferase
MNEVFTLEYLQVAKILTYSALAFFIAMWWAPYLIELLTWLKFWKKHSRSIATSGEKLTVTKKFFEETEKKRLVPRAGGVLIWLTTLLFAAFFWLVLKIAPTSGLTQFLNFVSRSETFIPIGTLFFGSMLGLIDDAMVTMESGGKYSTGGLHLNQRILMVTGFSFLISLWFYFQIDLTAFSLFGWDMDLKTIPLPFNIPGGLLVIPLTLVILLGSWSTRVIDGLDGLSAGVFIPVMICFAALAFARGLYDMSTLLMVMAGSTVAYLWYNIPPAKFYLGDTGTDGVLLTLGVVAMLIDYIYILPIAGLMLCLTTGSVIVQLFSKKFFKRKVFLAAPLHHHFEASGWDRNQVTMRYWLITWMMSGLGVAIGLLFR